MKDQQWQVVYCKSIGLVCPMQAFWHSMSQQRLPLCKQVFQETVRSLVEAMDDLNISAKLGLLCLAICGTQPFMFEKNLEHLFS
jgi:hypothetical protein